MKNQVVILGLGMIGASVGLALANHKDEMTRIGHDKDLIFSNKAKRMGAVDQTVLNLHKAVEKADILFLCLPANEIKKVMVDIADDLKDDVVIFDTTPVRKEVDDWAQEILPSKIHYIGLTPILNPEYLHTFEGGINGATADLFKDGYFSITCNAYVAKEAIDLAIAMVDYLGAESIFGDLVEVDGLMASGHILPQLVSGVLMNTVAAQTGWFDIRKYAGRAFAQTTASINNLDLSEALTTEALLNKSNIVRMLKEYQEQIRLLTEMIENDDASRLNDYLEIASDERETWWNAKQTKSWEKERPDLDLSSGDVIKTMFGRLPDNVRKMGEREDK